MPVKITVKKLTTLTNRIEYCLERYPHTRNSDIDLFASVCENFYPPFERPLYNYRDLAGAMHQLPSLDHVARLRRNIIRKNNYKKYLPTNPNIAIFRGISEQIWRIYAKANNIAEPVNDKSNIPEGYDDEGKRL